MWGNPQGEATVQLVRMLPSDVPGLDFREAESEVQQLLSRNGLSVAAGHLKQAISAFSRGEWSSANGALRNFYESYLNEIADRLGYSGPQESKLKRDYLGGGVTPPFLLAEYNVERQQSEAIVQGLMNRLHPHEAIPACRKKKTQRSASRSIW